MIANKFGFTSLHQQKCHLVDEPLVSVLVRVKNEVRAIDAFLTTLKHQNIFERVEVIFLDSGSNDGTLEKLLDFPASVYSISPTEFSFGATCNLLCSIATAPILSLMSGHIEIVESDTLHLGINALEKGSPLTGAYYRQIPNEALGSSSYERAQLRRRFPQGYAAKKMLSGQHAFSNAGSIFSAQAWRENPFPSVAASEDYLWAERLITLGGEIIYLNYLPIKHSHNETPAELFKRVMINVDARSEGLRSWRRAAKYFLGVTAACMLEGSGPSEALRYARAHAAAYAPKISRAIRKK